MEENHAADADADAGSGMRGSSGTPSAGSRWNPTKEQISMLENLFKQGIRNPNAEQIQHITSSLREYGHIEGKNVFYWFQNHKARQRQKQKQINQQRIPHFNCYNNIHACTSQPIFSPPLCQNDVCVPHCLQVQQNGMSFLYPQQQKVLAAKQVVSFGMPRICGGPRICSQLQQNYNNFGNSNQWQLETLTLFPLHPTGILEGKATHQAPSISVDTSSASHDIDVEDHHL